MRREFSAKTKVAAFVRSGGRCEACSAKLFSGNCEYDHRIPDAMGGEPTLGNCVCLCRACHGRKTATQDAPAIAKAKRIEARHIGARRSARPMPGSRASGQRKRMNGTVERWPT